MIALLEAQRAGLFSRQHLARDLLAGVVVGIVALPLAMAFAIASGAKPEHGLYTAIIAGMLVSAFGGCRLQIAGPTGAFIVILSGITAQYGLSGLQIATLMAGVMLVLMGVARFGAVIKYIPEPVIVGFTAGIGVIIWVGQWKDFFGLQPGSTGLHFHQKLSALLHAFPALHPATTGLGLLTLAILLLAPKIIRRIPAPLIAMVAATLIQKVAQFDGVATIGTAFGGIPQALPAFSPPEMSFSDLVQLLGPAFTIALLGAIESLLSAVVADGMAGTRHDPNQELIGQGIANIFAPLFGGFAATGAIARTATNVRNGATSPLAGIIHALFLVLVILILAPLASDIPLCALSAILFVVAWNMSDLSHFLHLARRSPRPDVAILLISFLLTVFADLVIAVNVGVVLASLLFMHRMAQSVQVQEETVLNTGDDTLPAFPPNVMVYSIDGPFFFGAAEKLEVTLNCIQSDVDTVILRMHRVPFMDATGLQALSELVKRFQTHHKRLVLTDLPKNIIRKLHRAGILRQVGRGNLFRSLAQCQVRLSPPSAHPMRREAPATPNIL